MTEAPPPAMAENISAAALLAWRRRLLLDFPDRGPALDWLLELEGGLGWPQLQACRLYPERPLLLERPLGQLEALWWRHCHGDEPLQYLVGRCPWRDLELQVAPAVLIPRQETELLVELALGLGLEQGSAPPRWADLGTGSGCLALALALAWPESCGWAVDCSGAALALAAANGGRLALDGRIQWRQGSWWQPLEDQWGRLPLVLSNPPYIPSALLAGLDPVVRDHEPWLALDGGGDGLDCLREIAAGARRALAPGGWLLLEHHHDQSLAVAQLLAAAGLEELRVARDLEGKARFALARAPGGA
ncbi:MAG: peptide chain release factor N(5)-glutamine methyltransferase [Synechococcus lacustris]